MKIKEINVIKDFNKKPYGRYPSDGDGNGQKFREEHLVPALKRFDLVEVDLTGYNRYGRSFIDEAFGGLIRVEKFTLPELKHKLRYQHKDVKSIELLIKERLEAADNDTRR